MRLTATVLAAATCSVLSRPVAAEETICAKSETLYCNDFEAGSLAGLEVEPDVKIVQSNVVAAFDGSATLQAELDNDGNGATLGHRFADVDRVYVRFYLRFDTSWTRPMHHFYAIHGDRGDWSCHGGAGCRPTGALCLDGTTVDSRMGPGGAVPGEPFFYAYTPDMSCDSGSSCDTYADSQAICSECAGKGMPCQSGPECCWGNHYNLNQGIDISLQKDRWHAWETMVKANTPGMHDGEMSLWIDGQLVAHHTGLLWRTVSDLHLNHFVAWNYFPQATAAHRIWFDNLVISTAPIGLLGAPPDTSEEEEPATDGGVTNDPGAQDPPAGGCGCRAPNGTGSVATIVMIVGFVLVRRRRGARVRGVAVIGMALLVSTGGSADAAPESRCVSLGANCLWARDMQTAGPWTFVPSCLSGSGCYYDADQDHSDPKLAGSSFAVPNVGTRKIIWTNSGNVTSSVAGAGFNQRNVWRVSNWGAWVLGPDGAQISTIASSAGRYCVRYYFSNSANYTTANQAPASFADCDGNAPGCCNNDKYLQLGDYITSDTGGFKWHGAAEGFSPNITVANTRQKWWRIEMCVNNPSNISSIDMYMKNVSDDLPEQSRRVTTVALARQYITQAVNEVHRYRGGGCVGSTDLMYHLAAMWPTVADQRIGAAVEVESSAPPPDMPPPDDPPDDEMDGDEGDGMDGDPEDPGMDSVGCCDTRGRVPSSNALLVLGVVFAVTRSTRRKSRRLS
jgi:hypothetical protein